MNARVLAGIGGVVVAVVIGAAFVAGGDDGNDAPTDPATAADVDDATATANAVAVAVPDLPDRGQHLELVDIDGWLQSDVTSLEELEGKVVAVQFWTFGCSNCKATLPHMSDLYEKYQDEGFEIVGIHAPEFDYEADEARIVEAAIDLGVSWPIALDPTKRTFHSWQEGPTAHWPRIYLLDRDGHIRYDHIGEGRYDQIDGAIQALLAEPT
jgi:thiol-disulfide isomerase/thioredoxin